MCRQEEHSRLDTAAQQAPTPPNVQPSPCLPVQGALPQEHAGTLPPTAKGPAAGYEPTVTISTKAAFDAINQVPHWRGGGEVCSAARGPALLDVPCCLPTRSIPSTLSLLVQMFGASAAAAPAQQQQDGFHVPAPRPPRARAAQMAAPAAESPAQQQQDGFHVPAPRPPRARAAQMAAPAAESPGGFCVHEDTQFVSVPMEEGGGDSSPQAAPAAFGRPSGSPSGFCIRDDTMFVTVPADGEEEGAAQAAAAMGGGGDASPASPGMSGGGFSIREDTMFVTVAMQREEEEYEELAGAAPDAAADAPPAAEAQPTCSYEPSPVPAAAPPASGGLFGGFEIREDTMFMGGGGAGGASGPFSPSASSEAGGSTGGLLGAEVVGAAREGSPSHSSAAVQVREGWRVRVGSWLPRLAVAALHALFPQLALSLSDPTSPHQPLHAFLRLYPVRRSTSGALLRGQTTPWRWTWGTHRRCWRLQMPRLPPTRSLLRRCTQKWPTTPLPWASRQTARRRSWRWACRICTWKARRTRLLERAAAVQQAAAAALQTQPWQRRRCSRWATLALGSWVWCWRQMLLRKQHWRQRLTTWRRHLVMSLRFGPTASAAAPCQWRPAAQQLLMSRRQQPTKKRQGTSRLWRQGSRRSSTPSLPPSKAACWTVWTQRCQR